MMKLTLKGFAVAGILNGGLLFAGTFSDVPANHWAYKAVEQVSSAGIIQGYPGEKFQGDEKVSRYQMAIIIGRILEAIDNGAQVPSGVVTPLKKLTDEFGSELALIGARVNALEARTTFNEGRIDRLEEEVYEMKEYGVGGESKIRHSGSLEFMWQTLFKNGLSGTESSDPSMRFKLNLDGKINDRTDWGISLYTTSESLPSSSWRRFGDKLDGTQNAVGSVDLQIHKYFVNYRSKDFKFTFGKQENPFRNTELIFDRDIAPLGLVTEYKKEKNWVFRAGQFHIQSAKEGPSKYAVKNEDAYLFAHQAEYTKVKPNERKMTFKVASLNFTGEHFLHPINTGGTISNAVFNEITSPTNVTFKNSNKARSGNYYNWDSNANNAHTVNASTAARQGRLLSDFLLYNIYLEYKDLKNVENPWGVKFEYVVNEKAWNKDDEGFWLELYQGKLKEKGDIQYGVQYKKVEADAVLAFLNEDQLRTNTKAVGLFATSIIRDNVQWFNTYQRFEAANGHSEKKEGLFRTGLTFTF